MKKRPILITALALTLFASGCVKFNNDSNDNNEKKDVNEIAIERVEEKYNDSCEYSSPTGDSLTGTRAFLVRCNNLSGAVYVEIENYRESNKIYRDNYIAVKYAQETSDFLLREAKKEFSDARVFYTVKRSGLSPDISANATFNELLSDPEFTLNATIEVKGDDNYKTLAENMAKSIAATGLNYRIVLAVMDNQEFGIYDADEIGDKLVLNETKAGARLTNINNELKVDWD